MLILFISNELCFPKLQNIKFPNLEREYPQFKEFQGFAKCRIFGNLQMCTCTKWSNAISKVLIHVKFIMSRN
jgi:hypothetical protein